MTFHGLCFHNRFCFTLSLFKATLGPRHNEESKRRFPYEIKLEDGQIYVYTKNKQLIRTSFILKCANKPFAKSSHPSFFPKLSLRCRPNIFKQQQNYDSIPEDGQIFNATKPKKTQLPLKCTGHFYRDIDQTPRVQYLFVFELFKLCQFSSNLVEIA